MLARLERARDRQRRFVSDASHELRSPIATIRHQLEVALAHADRADLSTLARDLLDEDLRMQGLVEDLLVLARADEDAVSTERGAVDLDDLALAEARRLRNADHVAVDATGIHPVRVAGDQALLARAVRNLVDNAERHAHGMVRLEVHREGSTAVLAVVDDGPGVAQEHRQRVFERFTRLDEARSRGQGGSGLGLAIVAQVAAEHHGAVRCSEARGGGARFELRLPAVDVD
jgi:signal transduction histidine kinase